MKEKNNESNINPDYDQDLELLIDKTIINIGKFLNEENKKPSIINVDNTNNMFKVLSIVKNISNGKNIEISYSMHKPFNNCGSIQVVGDKISISNIRGLLLAINMSSTFSAYPRKDGLVEINFDFDNLTDTIS